MATLSSFFGSSGGGGAAGVASTFRVFYETGSMTVPSCAVFAAYGVIGGGGAFANACKSCCCCRRSGGGGGFSWKEASQSCASNFTVCAIVGAAACQHPCCCHCICSQGGSSCVSGFSGGTICATGGGSLNNCGCNAGMGYGGDINNCGGRGGYWEYYLGGAGAGGLYGKGGDVHLGPGGGGFGSGGGGGGGGHQSVRLLQCDIANVSQNEFCIAPITSALGGGGGGRGDCINGGPGLSGPGGFINAYTNCCNNARGIDAEQPKGGLIPQYTMCGYSQAKTFLSASGGGGAIGFTNGNSNLSFMAAQTGAPGGGGGAHCISNQGDGKGGGTGGFGAGGGSSSECDRAPGSSGIGAGAAGLSSNSVEWLAGRAGQGIAVVEYWVTTS